MKHAQEFLVWLEKWYKSLAQSNFSTIETDPAKIAIISVDMIVGFTYRGNLSSPRIKKIIPDVVELFQKAYDYGVRNFVLLQDTHNPAASEFSTYPKHAVAGTAESETISEIRNLKFSNLFRIIEKNSLSPTFGTGFDKWLLENKGVNTFIIVGDCTDLCVYTTAMDLKLRSDAANKKWKIIVAENCVETYDMDIATAQKLGAVPHPGDLLHKLFLYHMSLNGLDIVAKII